MLQINTNIYVCIYENDVNETRSKCSRRYKNSKERQSFFPLLSYLPLCTLLLFFVSSLGVIFRILKGKARSSLGAKKRIFTNPAIFILSYTIFALTLKIPNL